MSEGKKNDAGKLRFDLVPFEQFQQVVAVLTHGANEYSPNNWQQVPGARDRYAAALFRHATDYMTGKKADSDSGLPTLAHVVCNALFLMWFDDKEGRSLNGEFSQIMQNHGH